MKIAICDDCVMDTIYLEGLIKSSKLCPKDVDIVIFSSGEELTKSDLEFDALFIDMQMDGMDGIDTANEIRKRNSKAILSFYSGYEVGAHKVLAFRPFRYLMKDSEEKELSSNIDQILNEVLNNNQVEYINVRYQGNLVTLKLADILYISLEGKGTLIWVTDEKAKELWGADGGCQKHAQRSSCSLKEYYQQLKGCGFSYASVSYIVNIINVIKQSKNRLFLKGGKDLSLTRVKKKSYEEDVIRFWSLKAKERDGGSNG